MALRKRGDGSVVRAGDMDHQVKIWQHVQADDGQGGRTSTPAVTDTVWANLIPLSASRADSYGMTMNNKPHEVDLRWENTAYQVTEDDYLEVVETGQILYIHSVVNSDKRYERMKLLATEKR